MPTSPQNTFEILSRILLVTIDGRMYQISLDSTELKGWMMATFHRDTRTDQDTADLKFDDCTVALKADEWKQIFFLVMDHMLYEQIESLVDYEGLDCTVH